MAIKKEIEISVDSTAAQKALDKFGGTLEDIHGEGVQPLNFAIGELEDRLYELAAAGQQNSQEFRDMSAEVGAMKKVIIDTDLAVDAMAQTTAQNLGGAITGVAGAFELGQGAMASFGVEGEQVEEALLRVQGAMAMAQGLQGVKEGIIAFKGLRASIMSTTIVQKALNFVMNLNPVGMIIAGVVALGAAIALLWSPIKKLAQFFGLVEEETISAKEANEELNRSIEAQTRLVESLKKSMDRMHSDRMRQLKLRGASEKEIHEETLKQLKEQEDMRKREMGNAESNIEKKRRLLKDAREEEDWETAKAIREELMAENTKFADLKRQNTEYNLSVAEENKRFRDKEKEEEQKRIDDEKSKLKERAANYKSYLEKKKAIEREVEDAILSMKFDNEAKEQEANNLAFERAREDILARTELTEDQKITLIKAKENEAWQARQEIAAKWQAQMDEALAAKEEADASKKERGLEEFVGNEVSEDDPMLQQEEIRMGMWHDIKEKWRQKDEETNFEYLQRLAAQSEKSLGDMAQGLESLSALNDALTDAAVAKAGKNEAAAEAARKKGFERSKKLQLTMAIIQGVQGVMAAFTAGSSMGPAGVVMGPLMAAIAAVTAGINVAKISKMKYEGGGGGSAGGGSAPRAPSVPNPASFNVVGNDGTNQLADTLGEQEPIKAQVVSEEVTSQQSLDRNRMDNASFG